MLFDQVGVMLLRVNPARIARGFVSFGDVLSRTQCAALAQLLTLDGTTPSALNHAGNAFAQR